MPAFIIITQPFALFKDNLVGSLTQIKMPVSIKTMVFIVLLFTEIKDIKKHVWYKVSSS